MDELIKNYWIIDLIWHQIPTVFINLLPIIIAIWTIAVLAVEPNRDDPSANQQTPEGGREANQATKSISGHGRLG